LIVINNRDKGMLKMKKLFCLLLVFTMSIPVFAEIKITGQAPTVTGGAGADEFNRELQEAFDDAVYQINDRFSEIKYSNPQNLLKAMGNSSVYSSHGATTRGYGGYKIFSATIGPMFGLQVPSGISSIVDDVKNLSNTLKDKGDINLGFSPNMLNVNVGLNMGIFKLDKWYLGLRAGYFNLPNLADNFHYNNLTLGITANYQLMPSISLAGLVAWRGISLGSGIIYNNSKISFTMPLGDPINEEIGEGGKGRIYMDPEASLNLNTKTVIVPMEAITSIKLLIFNIPFGLGADLSFGSTSLGFGITSDIELQDLQGYTQATKGDIHVTAGASNNPSFFNFKIMTGFGVSAGPVVFDIPITFYPASKGYNFGLTIGAVF
jgi:hypothetical protein